MYAEASARKRLWGFELSLLVAEGMGAVRIRFAEQFAEGIVPMRCG